MSSSRSFSALEGPYQPIDILGDAGHAREVAELLVTLGHTAGRFLETSDEQTLSPNGRVVLGIGRPRRRTSVYQRLASQVRFVTLIHPMSETSPSSEIGVGSVICRGALVSSNTVVRGGCLINWNATIGHDCVIGVGCVVNPSAAVSGGVSLGNGVLIGAGAVVLEGVSIGDFARIGAGAVVTRDVSAEATVIGVPAR